MLWIQIAMFESYENYFIISSTIKLTPIHLTESPVEHGSSSHWQQQQQQNGVKYT